MQRPIRALKDRGFEVVEILPEADGHLDVAKLAAEVDKKYRSGQLHGGQ